MAAIYACAAGALVGIGADIVERIMNGEVINGIDGTMVAAAVTGCFWAACGTIVVSAALAAPTILGTCFILGIGGAFCLYAGQAICEGIANISGADVPWFCDFPGLGDGGGPGGPGGGMPPMA